MTKLNDYSPFKILQYCPYCGAKAFQPGGKNNLKCDICRQKFYINASAAVACIITNPQGKILLTRRKFEPAKGMLDLPGGFVDIGETAENAVHREVREELNLDIDSLQYIGSSTNQYLYGGIVYFTLDLGFNCLVSDFSGIKGADDVEDYIFLSPGEVDFRKISFPSIQNILKYYIEK